MQADALEHALMAALPLGPQSAAGGVSLPESFAGELQASAPAARDARKLLSLTAAAVRPFLSTVCHAPCALQHGPGTVSATGSQQFWGLVEAPEQLHMSSIK